MIGAQHPRRRRVAELEVGGIGYGQELMPGRVGMVCGLFFGLAFGVAGLGAAVLGALASFKADPEVYTNDIHAQ
jgi:hypothetical protein